MAEIGLKYHGETAELLGWSSPALRLDEGRLVEVEARLNQTLPASVREWIIYFGDMGICVGRNGDDAIGLEHLGESIRNHDALDDGYLIVMVENQGCCHWAVALDGSDDPPVFQTENLAAYREKWNLVARHFSEFALARVWRMNCVFDARFNWSTLGSPFGGREMAYLRATMKEGPITTDWPCGVHRHFADAESFLWVFEDEWFAGSQNRSSLEDLTRRVWWLAGTGAESFGTDFDDSLYAIRASQPPFPGPGWEKLFGDALDERFANGCFLGSREDEAVVPPALDELLDDFDEAHRLPLAGGLLALTLARPGQRIYLVTGDHRDPEARSAWWLHGDDVASLAALARHSRRWGTLANTLRATTVEGREALRSIEGE